MGLEAFRGKPIMNAFEKALKKEKKKGIESDALLKTYDDLRAQVHTPELEEIQRRKQAGEDILPPELYD